MAYKKYEDIAKNCIDKPHKIRNALRALFVGGLIGLTGEVIYMLLQSYGMDNTDALTMVNIIVITVTMLLTAFGLYDKIAQFAGAGCFIPISGFANSLCSSALEHKHEGPIYGIGSNMFKLAGSVLTYGITFAYITVFIRWLVSIL